MIEVPISIGEVIDKITILEIKKEKIQDQNKLSNINNEYDVLKNKISGLEITEEIDLLIKDLKEVNLSLWNVEDKLRILEKNNQFDDEFIDNARSVYKLNDERFSLKKKINLLTQSNLIEEKSYCK